MHVRWDALTIAALVTGVIAVSSSGALIAYAAAPALAIAFWRNALATAVLAPVTATTRRAELSSKKALGISAISGLTLAVHFGTWVPSVKLTSIATATALVCTQPVWAGLLMVFKGDRLKTWTWAGIAIAVVGVALAAGADIQTGGTAIFGDVLAICGAIAGAAYTLLGQRVRTQLSTTTYTTVCYGVCAFTLLIVCLVSGVQLTGFTTTAWLAILALTAGPQLLGHSMLNYAVKQVPAVTLNVIVLLEVPGAILLGWAWLGQTVGLTALAGIALLLAGVALVVINPGERSGLRPQPASDL